MYLIIRWIASGLILLAIDVLLPGISISGIYIALISALLLGLINATIKPVLKVLTLPLNIITLGLFSWVINGLLFWFVSSFVQGFYVAGFWTAILGALILSAGNWLVSELLQETS